MPILLSTPFNPGDIDPGVSYPYVQIVGMRWFLSGVIEIEVARGRIVDGAFIEGKVPRDKITVANNPRLGTTEYTTLLTGTPSAGESTYQAVGRGLYTYLRTKNGFMGTIV